MRETSYSDQAGETEGAGTLMLALWLSGAAFVGIVFETVSLILHYFDVQTH